MSKEARGQTKKGRSEKHKKTLPVHKKKKIPEMLKNKCKTQITVRDIAQKKTQQDLLVYIKTDNGGSSQ